MMKKILFIFTLVLGMLFTACKPEPKPTTTSFNIVVSDITESTAFVTVEPSDTTVFYYFDVMPAEYWDEYEGDTAIAREYLEWIADEVEYYNAYDYPVEFIDWLSQGNDSYNFEGLTANKEYVAFAFEVDTATNMMVGDLYKVRFTTLAVEPTLLTFELANSDTALWFLPNSDEITYFADYVSVDTLTVYEITATEYFDADVEYYGEYISYFTQKGPIYLPWSYLNPGTTYVFLARAYTGGEWNSDLFTTEFTVPAVEAEAPGIRLKQKVQKRFDAMKFTGTQLKHKQL